MLNIRGRHVSIYCHNMNSYHPQEYLTLKAGPDENYALHFDKRSNDETKCPSGHYDDFIDQTIPYGTTRFSKVKLNIHTLQVIEDDFVFSVTNGKKQSFGSAGDCYSNTQQCPQGRFSINLNGTSFRIRPKTKWSTDGPSSTIEFVQKVNVFFFFLNYLYYNYQP